LLTGNVPN
jgi:ubiquitin-like protein 4